MVDNYDQQYNRLLTAFTAYQLKVCTGDKWGMNIKPLYRTTVLLFLYLRALIGYDPTILTNHLTDEQVYFIFKQVTKLIGANNGPVFI